MLRPEAAPLAAFLFVLAIATDLADGVVARRLGGETAFGRALDHGADFLFVSAGLAAAAWRGAIPWLLPGVVGIAFAQYVGDARVQPAESGLARGLRTNPLGRANGVLYFVPLGGDILVRLGVPFLAAPTRAFAWGLVVTTLLSMSDRLRVRISHR